jgi:hypothetical protein
MSTDVSDSTGIVIPSIRTKENKRTTAIDTAMEKAIDETEQVFHIFCGAAGIIELLCSHKKFFSVDKLI